MQAASSSLNVPALQSLLKAGTLAGKWALDPGKSSIQLKTRSMGLVPVNGVFREVSGSGVIAPDGSASGTLTVATASIDTRNTRRDTHLRSADFFDSDHHRDISFTADRIQASGQGVAVTGTLTVRGRTRPLSLGAAAVSGDGEIWLDAKFRVNRADFGITWNQLGMVALNSTVIVHAAFIRR